MAPTYDAIGAPKNQNRQPELDSIKSLLEGQGQGPLVNLNFVSGPSGGGPSSVGPSLVFREGSSGTVLQVVAGGVHDAAGNPFLPGNFDSSPAHRHKLLV